MSSIEPSESLTSSNVKSPSEHQETPEQAKQKESVSYLNVSEEDGVYGFLSEKKLPPITKDNVLEENENIINKLYSLFFKLCNFHFLHMDQRINESSFSDKEKARNIANKLANVLKEQFIKIYEYAKSENASLWDVPKLPPEDLEKIKEFNEKKDNGYFQKEMDNEFERAVSKYEDTWREYIKAEMREEVEHNILKRREYNREKGLFPEKKIEEIKEAIMNYKKPDDSKLMGNMQNMKEALDIIYEKIKK